MDELTEGNEMEADTKAKKGTGIVASRVHWSQLPDSPGTGGRVRMLEVILALQQADSTGV